MEDYLTQVFIHIINTGYQAGIAVIAILLARSFFHIIRVPEKYTCLLWFIPFIRLILPFQPQSIFSLLPRQAEPVPVTIAAMEQPVIYTNSAFMNQIINPITAMPESGSNPLQFGLFIMAVIWIAGAISFFLYGIVSVIYLKNRLRTSVCENDNIYLADGIPTAFVMGIYKPRIYLPSGISVDTKKYVICHERQHIRRKDHITKFFIFTMTCVYWFHPLIWLAYFLANKDIETACDEAAIKSKPKSYRIKYAEALLSLSVDTKTGIRIPLAFCEGNPKKRIKHIISYKKPLFIIAAAGIPCILFLAIGLLTKPVDKSRDNTGTDSSDKNVSTQASIKLQTSSGLEVTPPAIDLSATVGADNPKIYYVDENHIIFGGYFGLFVYSKTEETIIRGLDLKAIGCDRTQGDNYCEISIAWDGSTAYLHPIRSDDMYVYSVTENTLTKENYNLDNVRLYTGADDEEDYPYSRAFYLAGDKKIYCVLHNSSTIGSISWSENDGVHHNFFSNTP